MLSLSLFNFFSLFKQLFFSKKEIQNLKLTFWSKVVKTFYHPLKREFICEIFRFKIRHFTIRVIHVVLVCRIFNIGSSTIVSVISKSNSPPQFQYIWMVQFLYSTILKFRDMRIYEFGKEDKYEEEKKCTFLMSKHQHL